MNFRLKRSLGVRPKLSPGVKTHVAAARFINYSPVGTAGLPNFNPCSAATLQLGHIHRGYAHTDVCACEL